jgi:hypothetical protein
MGLGSNGMSPSLVTWESFGAWSDFMRIPLEPWEARTLVELGLKQASIESDPRRYPGHLAEELLRWLSLVAVNHSAATGGHDGTRNRSP